MNAILSPTLELTVLLPGMLLALSLIHISEPTRP